MISQSYQLSKGINKVSQRSQHMRRNNSGGRFGAAKLGFSVIWDERGCLPLNRGWENRLKRFLALGCGSATHRLRPATSLCIAGITATISPRRVANPSVFFHMLRVSNIMLRPATPCCGSATYRLRPATSMSLPATNPPIIPSLLLYE